MKLEDLRGPWRDANAETATPMARDELIAHACRGVERLWAVVFRRDWIETAAAAFVMYFFLKMTWKVDAALLERVGAGVVVAAAVFIVYRLHAVRLNQPAAALDAPVAEFCRTELSRLESQIRLLKTVHLWYVGPVFTGLVLLSLGRHGFGARFFVDLGVFVAVGWGIRVLNRYAARKQLEPIRDQLLALAKELEPPDDAV